MQRGEVMLVLKGGVTVHLYKCKDITHKHTARHVRTVTLFFLSFFSLTGDGKWEMAERMEERGLGGFSLPSSLFGGYSYLII